MDLDGMFRKEAEKYKNSKSVEVYEEQLEGWFKIIDELREENKKLNERIRELEDVSKDYDLLSKDFIALGEENKKLKSDLAFERTMLDNVRAEYESSQNINKKLNVKIASLEGEIKGLNYTIERLKEENQTLELWLDNKEKLNEEYRKQIDKYKKQYQHSMGEDDELIYEEGL